MEFEEIQFIDKELVHKTNQENVHIYNLRRELPRNIEYSTFEQAVLPSISDEERKFLTKYYKVSRLHYDPQAGTGFYVLRDIPYSIDKEKAELALDDAGISDEDKKAILDFYKYDETFGLYNLIDDITEEEVIHIQKALNKRNLQISDGTRRALSDILEKAKGLEKEKRDTYNANMYIEQKHSYFFEHPNEHVPGMMMVETARQLLVACGHVYGNVPINSNFMLLHMDLKFQRYVELNFPVRIHVEMNKLNKSKLTGAWSYFMATVTFYQKHMEVSKMLFEASVVAKSVFDKLREEKEISGQLPRFWPLRKTPTNSITIRDNNDENRYLCSLVDLSLKGFLLRFSEDSFMLDSEDANLEGLEDFKFLMYFEVSGFINGKCKIRWVKKDIDSYMAGFEITQISELDRKNLNEAIKRYFFVREDRGDFVNKDHIALLEARNINMKMNTNITFQKPDLILIDFDGVIAKNSPDFAVHLFHQALNEITPIKVEFIIDFFRLAMSFSVKDSLEFLFKSLGLSQDEKKTVTENYKNKVSNNLNLFHINKDFYCFIEFCKNNNIKYKVFSLAVDSRLSLIKLEPNDFYNLEDMSKANVKTFLKVKKNLNVENVSYIDDSPLGLRTGKLSGMNTIMMYNSLFGVSEYLIYKEYIDYSVSSFSEIQTIFSNLLSN